MNELAIEAQVEFVERELRMRLDICRRRIAEGAMSLAQANSQMDQMRAVLRTLHRVQDGLLVPSAGLHIAQEAFGP